MERYNFDLDEEMLRDISKEFDPVIFVKGLRSKDQEDITSSFRDYGKNLARKSIEEGEKRVDRTYEIMREAIEKTGEMGFPFIAQRYIEISYLSVQPIKRLWVLMNNSNTFAFRINDCSIYQAIKKEYGEEMAKRMLCKWACFSLIDNIFSYSGFQTDYSLEMSMESSGYCQFRVEKR